MIKLLEVEFPKKFNLSKEVKDLINKLLNKNPMYRIGTNGGKEEIMKHPWFNDINWKKVYDKKNEISLYTRHKKRGWYRLF